MQVDWIVGRVGICVILPLIHCSVQYCTVENEYCNCGNKVIKAFEVSTTRYTLEKKKYAIHTFAYGQGVQLSQRTSPTKTYCVGDE